MNHLHPKPVRLLSLAVVIALVAVQTAFSQSTISNTGNAAPQVANLLLTPITDVATSANQKIIVSVFPNPATENITIQSSSPIHLVSIIDILGRTIKQAELNQQQAEINLAGLVPGRYFIRIIQQDSTTPIIKSFVKV